MAVISSTVICMKCHLEARSTVRFNGQIYQNVHLPDKHEVDGLDSDELKSMNDCYTEMYSPECIDKELVGKRKNYKTVKVGNEKYSSSAYGNGQRHGCVLASWCGSDGQIDFNADFRLCVIKRFIVRKLGVSNCFTKEYKSNVFADSVVRSP